jgi:hypothetical protein
MNSTNRIDFSIRPNKSIERSIVFDSLREYLTVSKLRNTAYVGFGSVWFADFVLAHKRLKISKMVSIERDPVTASRALFNCPYRFLKIEEGKSGDVLPELLNREGFRASPWIVWLDYDGSLCEDMLDDIYLILNRVPPDSALLVTFNVQSGAYGEQTKDRRETLQDLFPEVDIDEKGLNTNASFSRIIQQLLIDEMVASTSKRSRDGIAVPAFNMSYKDTRWMGTVGVLLPRASKTDAIRELVLKPSWRGMPKEPIDTPLLTSREVAVLQSQLPRPGGLTERQVRKLGFDLEQARIDAYVKYYADYPTFVQVGP